jgi:hypothetical protein
LARLQRDSELKSEDEALRIASNIAKPPDLLRADNKKGAPTEADALKLSNLAHAPY